MKRLFAICVIHFLDTVWTAPPEVPQILEYDFQNDGTGPYYFNYLTSDGQSREERSEVEDAQESLVIRGSYSYTGPEGIVYTVRYTADHNGFHPEGDHINVPPYIPWPKGHHQDDESHSHLEPSHVVQIKPPTQRPPTVVPADPVSPVYLPSTPKPPPLRPQRPLLDVSFPTTQYLPSSSTPPRPPPRPITTTLPPPRPAADDPASGLDPYYYTTPRPYLSSSLQPSTRISYRHNQANRITSAASETVTTRTLPPQQQVAGSAARVLPLMRLLQQDRVE